MDRTWIAPVILALVVAATGFYFLHMAEQVRQQRLHLSLRQSVLQAQEKLTARMNQVRSVLTALEALALSAPNLTQDDFATFAAILDERFGDYRSLQLAPGGVITFAYPLPDFEDRLGLDLLRDPLLSPLYRQVLLERKTAIRGPLLFREESHAVAGIRPIYRQKDGKGYFWGFALAVVDLERFLADAVLPSRGDLNLALRRGNWTFWGEPSLFEREDAVVRVIPDTDWELAALSFELATPEGTRERSIVVILLAALGSGGALAVILRQNRTLTEQRRYLAALSEQDSLTGLANRRQFDRILNREWRRARRNGLPLSLVMADVDFFKAYNDRYGHLAGDDCLVQLSTLLEGSLRRPGDLAVRYGGEEFVLLLPETDADGARRVAEAVRQAVEEEAIAHDGSPLGHVTISLGAATVIPDRTEQPSDLIALADERLYRAKEEGRNRLCFD